MFGRKRKQEEEGVGLAGLGTGSISSPVTVTPSVNVTPGVTDSSPAEPPRQPEPQAQAPGAPAAIPGFPPGGWPTSPTAMLGQILSGHGPVADLVAQIKADPDAFRQRIMSQMQAAGYPNVVMMSPQWREQQVSAPQHVDVIDELTKAAHLHDQGALTDAEFGALKKKLLGD
jgi:Short C-terminal domain